MILFIIKSTGASAAYFQRLYLNIKFRVNSGPAQIRYA